MFVAAVFVVVVGIFSFVAAMEVSAYLIVDVETHGVLGVEDGVVGENKSVRRVLHLGFGAELQIGMGSTIETVVDAQVIVVAATGCVDLRGQPCELELVGVGEDVPIGCRCGFHTEIDAALPLVATAFAESVGIEVLVDLAVVAIHEGKIQVTSGFDS